MKTIWKYKLDIRDEQIIQMPVGSEILTVQVQKDVPCLWVMVNYQNEPVMENRIIGIYGTGNPIFISSWENEKYIATFQIYDELVFHVYELIKKQ